MDDCKGSKDSNSFLSFRPSETCGPFRGHNSFFEVVSEWVNTFSCITQLVLDYFSTASFVIPVIALLLYVSDSLLAYNMHACMLGVSLHICTIRTYNVGRVLNHIVVVNTVGTTFSVVHVSTNNSTSFSCIFTLQALVHIPVTTTQAQLQRHSIP